VAESAAPVLTGRHRWVGEILARSGAVVEGESEGVYSVRLGDELGTLLKRERMEITFRKRLAGRGGVTLASPGSWFHDQLLRFARQRGTLTAGYLPARDDVDRDKTLAARRRNFVSRDTLVETRYGTILVFTFHLAYYSEPAREDVHHVAYDCERGRVDKRPVHRLVFRTRKQALDTGIGSAPAPDVDTAFAAAWALIQDAVAARIHTIQREGRASVAEKIETVERYYRQLLAEEKRLLKTRASRRSEQETRNKIDLLKLEWERRVKEETERLKPQVIASLCAVARIWVPMERWRCTLDEAGGKSQKDIWLDLARGEAWEAAPPAGKR
jgi:hypothetical protein